MMPGFLLLNGICWAVVGIRSWVEDDSPATGVCASFMIVLSAAEYVAHAS